PPRPAPDGCSDKATPSLLWSASPFPGLGNRRSARGQRPENRPFRQLRPSPHKRAEMSPEISPSRRPATCHPPPDRESLSTWPSPLGSPLLCAESPTRGSVARRPPASWKEDA